MNVIELLKKDHQAVAGLFESFEAAKESEANTEKQEIVGRIIEELSAHATAEEEIFYPAVAESAEEEKEEQAADGVKEANEEHALVKQLLSQLEELDADDEQFDAKVKVLKDLVEHHVEEEEGQLMPRAKKLLSAEQLEGLGTRCAARKQELKSEAPEAQKRPAARKAASGRSTSRSAPRAARTSTRKK